ncbi:MAG: ABC transporter ATP-binding protein [Gemmatimonadaceae bacterium]|nr:ABC transporter ATP-binding protein [Gemmatimonadaceae bacterium]
MTAAITIRGLGKRYARHGHAPAGSLNETLARWLGRAPARSDETFWALRDLDIDVPVGQVLGVIGRNGAGKSTLLKILARVTAPTEGYAEVRGRVGSLLEVGTGFHPELSGRDNILLNGLILGMSRREVRAKFDEIVAFAEMDRFIDTPVKYYSSGMYMRLAFAVPAHLDADVLLTDEVLAVGDVQFQAKCLGKMKEVASGGRTVLFVSHNMNAVADLCSAAVCLKQGRIEAMSSDVRSVIRTAIAAGGGDAPRAEWRAEQVGEFANPFFTPTRMAITDASGVALPMPLARDVPAYLWLEGSVEREDPGLELGFALHGEGGELLFWSTHTDGPPRAWPPMPAGRATLRAPLPLGALNEGRYRADLICSLFNREWVFEPGTKAPTLTYAVEGGLSESPYWRSARPGLMAPVLEWERVG